MNIDIQIEKYIPPNVLNYIDHIQFGRKEQQGFIEDISALVADGVPASYAVDMVGKITKHGVSRKVAAAISLKLAEGKSLADGMIGWFPTPIVELVRAGERGGTLDATLQFAAKMMGQSSSVVASFISSLLYPMAVVVMGCFVAVFVNNSVFTQFMEIRPVDQWPEQGQQLVALANFIQGWWWAVLLLIALGLFGLSRMLKNYTGTLRPIIDHLPVLSIYRRLAAARFMETLGMLVGNGVAFKQALKIMHYNTTPYMAEHIVQMEYRLGMGKLNIAEVLDTGLIDHNDILRLEAVSHVKGVEHSLIRLGAYANDQGNATIKLTGKIIGGILLSIGAGLAFFMVMAIYAVGSSLSGGA